MAVFCVLSEVYPITLLVAELRCLIEGIYYPITLVCLEPRFIINLNYNMFRRNNHGCCACYHFVPIDMQATRKQVFSVKKPKI